MGFRRIMEWFIFERQPFLINIGFRLKNDYKFPVQFSAMHRVTHSTLPLLIVKQLHAYRQPLAPILWHSHWSLAVGIWRPWGEGRTETRASPVCAIGCIIVYMGTPRSGRPIFVTAEENRRLVKTCAQSNRPGKHRMIWNSATDLFSIVECHTTIAMKLVIDEDDKDGENF